MTQNIHEQEPDEIMFAGDWHGYSYQAINVILAAHERGINHILHVGDFGIWNTQESMKFLQRVNKACQRYNVHIYFVDGNHEDHPFLRTFPQNPDGTLHVRENISYLPRGFRWEWNTIRYMAMGGAYSVDRNWRKLGTSYFEEEVISKQDILKVINDTEALEDGTVDVLVTHDSPTDAPNPVTDNPSRQANGIRMFGEEAIGHATAHRLMLRMVAWAVKPVLIVHGHYHASGQGSYHPYGNATYRTDVVSLDEGATDLKYHTLSVTLADLLLLKEQNRGVSS